MSDGQHPHAPRAGEPLAAGRDDGVGTGRYDDVPDCLGGVEPHGYAVPVAQLDHLGGRLHQATVGRHVVDEHHVGRVVAQETVQAVEVEHARTVDRQELHGDAVRLQQLEVRTPLGGRDRHPVALRQRPGTHQGVQRGHRTLDERDALRVGAEQGRDVVTQPVELRSGVLLRDVAAELGLEPGVSRDRVQRRDGRTADGC